MRSSQLQRLLDVEYARRCKRYGRNARITQLKWFIALSGVLYILLTYLRWSRPRPMSSVWIDGVRVEVMDEYVSDKVAPLLMWGALVSVVALFVTYMWCDDSSSTTTEPLASVSSGNNLGQGVGSRRRGETCAPCSSKEGRSNAASGAGVDVNINARSSIKPSPLAVSKTATLTLSEMTTQGANGRGRVPQPFQSSSLYGVELGIGAEQAARAMDSVQPERASTTTTTAAAAAEATTFTTRPAASLPLHTAQDLHAFLQHELQQSRNTEQETGERSDRGVPEESVLTDASYLLRPKAAAPAAFPCASVKQGVLAEANDTIGTSGNGSSEGMLRVQYGSDVAEIDYKASRSSALASGGGVVATSAAMGSALSGMGGVGAVFGGGMAEEEWRALGVIHVEQCLSRVREWVSQVCLHVVNEVTLCNSLLAERQLSAFDCSHSLQEQVTVTMPPSSTTNAPLGGGGIFGNFAGNTGVVGNSSTTTGVSSGWGAGFGSTTTSSPSMQWGATAAAPVARTITKLEAIRREKEMVRIQQQKVQDFDTLLLYERRLSLELRLDLNSTFPPDTTLATSQLTARQQYVLHRLRTFAKQRTLVSFQNGGSNSHFYRDGFPQDAHLLLHILRTSVEGMTSYIRFSYQRMSHTDTDLAIYAGDIGEPYFYVRYNTASGNKLYPTHAGSNSLFEALLIFAAIIRAYHNDMYGGIRGTMDLQRTDMLRFFR